MEKIMTRHSSKFKYSFAYDEFGNCISLPYAMNDKRPYYFDKDKQIRLVLKKSSRDRLFWSALPNQKYIDIDGREYDYSKIENKISESIEHLNFKRTILEKGFFTYKNHNLRLMNASEESRIIDSRYESDISGELLDGTPCIIEVVKTSDISENKLNHIEENQILTFKIYIDEYGNQQHKRDYIVGNKEIESIAKSIRNGEGKIAELLESNKDVRNSAKTESLNRVQEYREELDRKKKIIVREVASIETQCSEIKSGESGEITNLERTNNYFGKELNDRRKEVERVESEIKSIEREISDIELEQQKPNVKSKEYEEQVIRLQNECRSLETTFIEIAEMCEISWFRNKWMTSPVNDKIEELKYWTS